MGRMGPALHNVVIFITYKVVRRQATNSLPNKPQLFLTFQQKKEAKMNEGLHRRRFLATHLSPLLLLRI